MFRGGAFEAQLTGIAVFAFALLLGSAMAPYAPAWAITALAGGVALVSLSSHHVASAGLWLSPLSFVGLMRATSPHDAAWTARGSLLAAVGLVGFMLALATRTSPLLERPQHQEPHAGAHSVSWAWPEILVGLVGCGMASLVVAPSSANGNPPIGPWVAAVAPFGLALAYCAVAMPLARAQRDRLTVYDLKQPSRRGVSLALLLAGLATVALLAEDGMS